MSAASLGPRARYEQDLTQPGFVADPQQKSAVDALEQIYLELHKPVPQAPSTGLFDFFKKPASTKVGSVKGLYLWGGVGRGKTYLVDTFHESLPFEQKIRTHFHRFMQRIHAELKTLGGRQDPLRIVADRLAKEARVLCFDEFHVSDITDAMLLGRLLEALFERGVTLVTTSNIEPDGLYKGGLQRQRFLPAIEQIKMNTLVMHMAGDEDFRLRALEQAEIYHHPIDDGAESTLQDAFEELAGSHESKATEVEILGRQIPVRAIADGVVWFDFEALCDGPRGAADYIEVARLFHTVLLSGVPQFTKKDNDRAARFIALVDELYDHSVNLLVTAVAAPTELYVEGRHEFAFQRTVSRLIEMQSRDYLHRPHLP